MVEQTKTIGFLFMKLKLQSGAEILNIIGLTFPLWFPHFCCILKMTYYIYACKEIKGIEHGRVKNSTVYQCSIQTTYTLQSYLIEVHLFLEAANNFRDPLGP